MPAYEVDYTIFDSMVVNANNEDAAEQAVKDLVDLPEDAELSIDMVTEIEIKDGN